MNILLIAKYPPLQGGVSAAVYHATLQAAKLGHSITVVTNSGFASATNRIAIAPSIPDEWNNLIDVRQITAVSQRAFIPWNHPDLSLLAGAALKAAQDSRPDFVVGWYLEPYGLAATLAAQLLNVPYCLVHAGSDVGRLALHRDLAPIYSAAIASARYVVTTRVASETKGSILNIAIDDQIMDPGNWPVMTPTKTSRPKQSGPYLEQILNAFDYKAFYGECSEEFQSLIQQFKPCAELLHMETPIVAMFGKMHSAKGYYNLASALDKLASSKAIDFRFLITLSGDEDKLVDFFKIVRDNWPAVARRLLVLPIVHPELMPDLLHHCDIVCCLDCNFSIKRG